MNTEQWKSIPDFPDYQISNRGRVRRGERMMRPDGTRIRLFRDGNYTRINMTALIYSLFPEEEIAALNGDGERWTAIPGWEKFYEVSDKYRVRRIGGYALDGRIINPRILSLSRNNGYLVAYLVGDKGRQRSTKFYVEAAVETTFPDVAPPRFEGMTQAGEQWKEIEGYEGLYEVSNLGRVRSIGWYVNGGAKRRYARPSLRKISVNTGTGYPKVELTVRGKTKSHMIHRLVASAFVPNPLCLDTVHHKDEDKLNARAENLEWITRARNIQDWFDRRRVVVGTDTIAKILQAHAAGHSTAEILAALPRKRKAGKS